MGVEYLFGIGLLIVAALGFLLLRFERDAGRQSEVQVREAEEMLAAFDVDVTDEPAARRRHRDGRHRRRRRHKEPGGDDHRPPST